jgi:hypothetical protein
MSEQSNNSGKMGPWTAGILALAAVLSFGLATLLEFWRGDTTSQAVEDVAAERYDRLAQLEDGMTKEVNSYRWVRKADGIVQLPIEVAMKATLPELQASKPGPSGVPVDPMAAVAAPAASDAGEPEATTDPQVENPPAAAEDAETPEAPEADAPAPNETPEPPAPETGNEEAQA